MTRAFRNDFPCHSRAAALRSRSHLAAQHTVGQARLRPCRVCGATGADRIETAGRQQVCRDMKGPRARPAVWTGCQMRWPAWWISAAMAWGGAVSRPGASAAQPSAANRSAIASSDGVEDDRPRRPSRSQAPALRHGIVQGGSFDRRAGLRVRPPADVERGGRARHGRRGGQVDGTGLLTQYWARRETD